MVKCLLFNVVEHAYLSRSLGIYRIAHVLREQNLDVEVADWSNHWSLEQLKEFFLSRNPEKIKLVGFSHLFSIWSDVLEEFVKWIKTTYPHVEIFSGSSVLPQFKSDYIGYYIQGFGENAVIALTQYLIGNGARPKFELKKINGANVIKANDRYPSYPMESLMVRYEDRDFLQPNEWLTTEFSRGCKFSCSFCNFPVLGVKGDYTRGSEDFRLQMLDTYDRFGIKNYIVADETFNDRTEKITKFADVVEKLPFDPFFSAYIRADLMISRPRESEELLRMRALGHFYGIESFNTPSAKAVGKGMSGDRLKDGLLQAKKYFETHGSQLYRGMISLIIGLPHESESTLNSTKKWLIDNWQRQAIGVHALTLPVGDAIKPSKMALEFAKYGYELTGPASNRTTPTEIAIASGLSSTSLQWKNSHMDIDRANEICDEFVGLKYKYDFPIGGFGLANRLCNFPEIKQRLDLSYAEFHGSRNNDITEYIDQKLNINTT